MAASRVCRFNLCALNLFFFNDTATTEIYTLSLHDALPICQHDPGRDRVFGAIGRVRPAVLADRKSTRLNSSHANTSYAVFSLKKTHPHSSRLCSLSRTRGHSPPLKHREYC